MSKIFTILDKPIDIYEINSTAVRHKTKDVVIYIYDPAKYGFQNLKNYILKKKIQKINYKIIKLKNIGQIKNRWEKIIKNYDIFILRYQSYFFLCKKINNLKNFNKKIFLLTNGVVDYLKVHEQVLSTNNIIHLHKIFYKFLYYKLVFPINSCHGILFPFKTTFTKNTFKINNIELNNLELRKILINKKINTLIIGTGTNINKILENYKIKNYCFTSKYLIKKKTVIVNGAQIKLKDIVISEEIINLKIIKNCYGILSTSTFYALLKKKKITLLDTAFVEGNFFYKFFLKLQFNRLKRYLNII